MSRTLRNSIRIIALGLAVGLLALGIVEVTVADFPCRDRHQLFKRDLSWVRHCARTLDECGRPRCMEALGVEDVLRAIPAR